MAGQVLGVEGGEGAFGALDALAQVLGVDVSRHVGGESGGELAVQTLDPSPVASLVQDQPAHTDLHSIQDHFVKTRFRRVWSNRDIGLFSFWPISPQFARENRPKPLKSVHTSGSHFGRPFSML